MDVDSTIMCVLAFLAAGSDAFLTRVPRATSTAIQRTLCRDISQLLFERPRARPLAHRRCRHDTFCWKVLTVRMISQRGSDMAMRSSGLLGAVLDPRGQPTNVVQPMPLAPRLDTSRARPCSSSTLGSAEVGSSLKRSPPGSHATCPASTRPQAQEWHMFLDEPQMWADARATPTRSSLGWVAETAVRRVSPPTAENWSPSTASRPRRYRAPALPSTSPWTRRTMA